jgi:hypothetical protein
MKRILALFLTALVLSACGDDGPPQYIKIAGGGIQFNYRVSEASMVIVAQQTRPLPAGSKIEALFDVPGTAERQSKSSPVMEGKLTYLLQSDKLMNITKGGQYKVTIRLLDQNGKELDRKDTIFVSDEDQSTLPTKPLVDDLALSPRLDHINP